MTSKTSTRGDLKVFSKAVGFIVVGIVFVYAVTYIDVVLRARNAFLEGEKYMEWNRDPAKKASTLDEVFQKEKRRLDQELSRQKLTSDDYASRLASLEFERKFQLSESSLKYAYQWYKDAYELFSPPESKWVKQARQKAPEALNQWKEELRAKKISFEDYMFE